MRLTAGGVREMHWHKAAEWAYMLKGLARITAIDQDGHAFQDDVGEGDLWYFPAGIPHSIQGLANDGAMGTQSAAVRRLHMDGIFTTAATATIIFLVGDITKWSVTAGERRRFVGVVASLFIGAAAGGYSWYTPPSLLRCCRSCSQPEWSQQRPSSCRRGQRKELDSGALVI